MALRIGFDLDGVLADMESELLRQSKILFGEPMTRRLQERAADPGDAPAAEPAADPPESSETGARRAGDRPAQHDGAPAAPALAARRID